eukprot:TRINITY_DN11645_c0_g2_i1.p1 TRINITY_DN11645_c0_g2~~TRINITY_DN11645_c0_g2_i1.p1  ORF type:complete len:406 (-),score=96.04 TRINITY_DN11645_c0_g2_i1:1022-2239(-)
MWNSDFSETFFFPNSVNFPITCLNDLRDFFFYLLATFILVEKSIPNSNYRIFLENLPKKLKTPFHWPDQLFNQIQGTLLAHQIKLKIKHTSIFFNFVLPCLRKFFPQFFEISSPYDTFTWVVYLLQERGQYFGDRIEVLLIPFSEFFNTKFSHPGKFPPTYSDFSNGKFRIVSEIRYEEGLEIFVSYSSSSPNNNNYQILSEKGFIFPNLKKNHPVRIYIPSARFETSDVIWESKNELFLGLVINPLQVYAYSGMGIPEDLMKAMRIYSLSCTDLISEDQKIHVLSLLCDGKTISISNEIIATSYAIECLEYTLGLYPTIIQEDITEYQNQLDYENFSEFGELSLRILEKKVLLSLKGFFGEKLKKMRIDRKIERNRERKYFLVEDPTIDFVLGDEGGGGGDDEW